MAQDLPEMVDRLANELKDVEQVEDVRTTGDSVRIKLDEKRALSANKIGRLLPRDWDVNVVVTASNYTDCYPEKKR